MVLHLDTTRAGILIAELRDGKQMVARLERQGGLHHAQYILSLVDELLRRQKVTLANLSAIEVDPGPGSFTGTRVGVAVANALGFALGLSVNGSAMSKGVAPVYDAPPKITVSSIKQP